MPSVTAETFLQTVEQSKLLSEEQMAAARTRLAADGDVKKSAKRLIKKRILTRWQTQQILAGNHLFFIGKYRLVSKLGEGGMGSVYKAQHVNSGRVVALKVMNEELLQKPGYVDRFLREVRAAAA
ncbi:MAG: hypothetical protein N2C14_01040, partial [Planctomycetales bacterium]